MKNIKTPGVDNNGYAYGTFDGLYEEECTNGDGSKVVRTTAEFITAASVAGETVTLKLFLSDYFGEDNLTGRFCKALGFVFKAEYGLTEDGVQQIISDNLNEVDDYLDAQVGKRYKFKLTTTDRGFKNIDVSTIREVVDAQGETIRQRKRLTNAA